jgi:hypothetical protein
MLSHKFLGTAFPVFVIPAKAGIQVFLCVFSDSDFLLHPRAQPNDGGLVLTNLRDSTLGLRRSGFLREQVEILFEFPGVFYELIDRG